MLLLLQLRLELNGKRITAITTIAINLTVLSGAQTSIIDINTLQPFSAKIINKFDVYIKSEENERFN